MPAICLCRLRLPRWRPGLRSLLVCSLALNLAVAASMALDSRDGMGAVMPEAHAADAPPPSGPLSLDGLVREQRSTAVLLSVLLLENAAGGSAPFAGELAYGMRVAEGDAQLLTGLDRLMRWAERGVPSRAELVGRFLPVVAEVRAGMEAARSGLTDRATLLMRDAALSVGIGRLPESDPLALVEAARSALMAGRLEEAAARLGGLPAPAGSLAARWREDAAARVEVEATLRELRPLALARALR